MVPELHVREFRALIEAERGVFIAMARDIWEHPEVGFQERYAAEYHVRLLKRFGFRVTFPYLGLDTAYRAEWGEGRPAFAMAAEYDALPGIGHACGHNLIGTAALAAAYAVKRALERDGAAGRVVVLGTPAEEGGSGKVLLERQGCLNDIDAAMMVHPSWRSTTDNGCLACQRVEVEFRGKAAHAAVSPEKGINALDAMLQLFASIAAWRQHIPESARVHGVIVEGGARPNIIPDHTRAALYLRAAQPDVMDAMRARFRALVEGACLATGCTHTLKFLDDATDARQPNPALNAHYKASMEALGLPVVVPSAEGRGSTDFGNFSTRRPGIHAYFAIADRETAAHSVEMAQAANSDLGRENTLTAAAAMADVAWSFLTQPAFRESVLAAFVPPGAHRGVNSAPQKP